MNTAYLLIIIMSSTITNVPIGAQAFEMQNLSECLQFKEFTDDKLKGLPKELIGKTGCFPQLGGRSKNI